MDTRLSPALMSEKEDLPALRGRAPRPRWWARASTSPRARVHRYAGILTIKDRSLVFRGTDLRRREDFVETIPLSAISEVSLGLDDLPEARRRRSFTPAEPEPLVVRHHGNGREETNYFITNFPGLSRRVDGNRYWYDRLRAEIGRSRLERDALTSRN